VPLQYTEPVALALVAKLGYEPLEPYPGSSRLAWKLRCIECRQPRARRLGQLLSDGRRCAHRRPQGAKLGTTEEARAAGFQPEEPYPGNVNLPWKLRCLVCGRHADIMLRRIRSGWRCAHRGWTEDPAGEARAAGYEALEPYPGNTGVAWKLRCATCGRPSTASLYQIRAGQRCTHQEWAEGAVKEARAAGYEPLEPYPGKAASTWKLRCATCGKPRRATLSAIRCGRLCRHKGWKGTKA
jgi:hypothetical protein